MECEGDEPLISNLGKKKHVIILQARTIIFDIQTKVFAIFNEANI